MLTPRLRQWTGRRSVVPPLTSAPVGSARQGGVPCWWWCVSEAVQSLAAYHTDYLHGQAPPESSSIPTRFQSAWLRAVRSCMHERNGMCATGREEHGATTSNYDVQQFYTCSKQPHLRRRRSAQCAMAMHMVVGTNARSHQTRIRQFAFSFTGLDPSELAMPTHAETEAPRCPSRPMSNPN